MCDIGPQVCAVGGRNFEPFGARHDQPGENAQAGRAVTFVLVPVAFDVPFHVDNAEVVEIDPRTDRVTAWHPLKGASRPHGMALDATNRLLFIANEGNATLLTVDLRTMAVIETHRVGEDPDVLAFDPGWRRLYVASESGVVSVFREQAGRLVPDGNLTMPHAHTVSVDPRTHIVYLPLESVHGRPVLRIMSAQES